MPIRAFLTITSSSGTLAMMFGRQTIHCEKPALSEASKSGEAAEAGG
jgi:hypothetical protein